MWFNWFYSWLISEDHVIILCSYNIVYTHIHVVVCVCVRARALICTLYWCLSANPMEVTVNFKAAIIGWFGIELSWPVFFFSIIPDLVRFQVLTATSMKMAVFWVVASCSLVEIYRCFRGPCCPHYQDDQHYLCFDRLDDGGSKHIWDVDKLLPYYTAQHRKTAIFELWWISVLHHIVRALPHASFTWYGWFQGIFYFHAHRNIYLHLVSLLSLKRKVRLVRSPSCLSVCPPRITFEPVGRLIPYLQPFQNGGRSNFWGGWKTCTSQRGTMKCCILLDLQRMKNF
jgi:hypothetical protein